MRIIVRGEKAYSLTSIALPVALKERVQDHDINMTEVCIKALELEVERREKVAVPA